MAERRMTPAPEGICPVGLRELEVIRSLARGLTFKQIAAEMGLAVSTIRTHMHNAYGRLGVVDRAQVVLLCVARGWIDNPFQGQSS